MDTTINIARETARIRATWSEEQRRRRSSRLTPRWHVPVIATTALLDAAQERIEDEREQFQIPEIARATA